MRKEIGKIKAIHFGFGGYQDAQLGVSVTLGSDTGGWGAGDFKGAWGMEPSEYAKWAVADQTKALGEACLWLRDILKAAKKQTVDQLKGVPVEATFDGNVLKEWRVLKEVI